MQHGRHPPGEALYLPDPPQAGLRIRILQVVTSGCVEVGKSPCRDANIRDCEIQSLGAGRRHDVGRIPSQKQPAVLHRLGHETAHSGDAFLK